MGARRLSIIGTAVAGLALLEWWLRPPRHSSAPTPVRTAPATAPAAASKVLVEIPHAYTNPPPTGPQSRYRHRFSAYTAGQKSHFDTDYQTKFRSAIQRWCRAYAGHLPFSPDDITTNDFVESVGADASYNEYVFVVDGITLGVRDARGGVAVDYLNAPSQTGKLAMLPDGSQAPILTTPVTRAQLTQMLEADSGIHFPANEIRMTPSGLSGSLNGGVIVSVGGDPENGASWKFSMVFGPDGNLVYYLRGQGAP